jgi:hypothetical protein
MVTLDVAYSREEALRDGVLINLADIVRDSQAGIPCPVAVSAGLWNRPGIDRDPTRLDDVVVLGASDWLKQGSPLGRFDKSILMVDGNGDLFVMGIQLIAEASNEHGMVVAFVGGSEDYDLRCPRAPGGSFHSV